MRRIDLLVRPARETRLSCRWPLSIKIFFVPSHPASRPPSPWGRKEQASDTKWKDCSGWVGPMISGLLHVSPPGYQAPV